MEHYNDRSTAKSYHEVFTKESMSEDLKRRALERFTMFSSSIKKEGQVLDAGCGTGRFVKYFIQKGFKVTGIDNSKPMIEIASRENPNVIFKKMDMRHLEFPPKSFDGIWNVATLVHFNEFEVEMVLREFKRVLKRDGALYIATRTDETDKSILEESLEGGKITFNYYSPNTLKMLLFSTGFEVMTMNVEPDDYSRNFNYIYILAKPSNLGNH